MTAFRYSFFAPAGTGRRILLLCLLGPGLLAGCSAVSSDSAPLPDSTFTRVLTELHLTAARRSIDAPYPSNLRDSVFARYRVRPAEFDASLKYYSRHPKAFKALYQSVLDTLRSVEYSHSVPEGVPDSVSPTRPRPTP